jgi:SAM-dependent methyltransferase
MVAPPRDRKADCDGCARGRSYFRRFMEHWRYRELYELEDRHWWFRGRRTIIWALLRRAGVAPSPRILDAGCGTGRNLVEFARLGEAEGVDFSEDAVAFCQRRGVQGVRRARLEELPFADRAFDLILATDVIEHLDDDREALAELRRVAATGARLVVTVPAYSWLWSQHDVSHHHRRRYTARRLREQVIAAGWVPVVGTYFFSAVLPAVAAVRTARKLRPDRNGHSDLEMMPSPLNRALELPARLEARLIERGARLPAGVSLGMVCKAP